MRGSLVWLSLGVAAQAVAATLRVGAGQPYERIQEAVDAAADGDTLLLAPGTYREHVVVERGVAIIGELGSGRTLWRGSDPELALLDYYALATTLRLRGIDFSGEAEPTPMERGVWAVAPGDGARIEVHDCLFHGFSMGSPDRSVMGIRASADTIRASECAVWDNRSNRGRGAFMQGFCFLRVTGCWFANNVCLADECYGAGLEAGSPDTIIKDNVFLDNGRREEHEYSSGGGLAMSGGAWSTERFDVIGNLFEGNEAHKGAAAGSTPDTNLISRNVFIANRARPWTRERRSGEGGALWVPFQERADITHNLFIGNEAERAEPFAETEPQGAALEISGYDTYVASNIFMHQSGAAAIWAEYSPNQRVVANLVWQNADGDYDGAPFPVELEVRGDPLFFAAEQGDYRLQPESPCVDAGDPDPPEGITRLDPDGTRLDIGAFPLDQSDFNVLYVVPHSTTALVGEEALFRVLIANLAGQARHEPLDLELRDSSGQLVARWHKTIRFPGQRSWTREVGFLVPEELETGRYTLRAFFGNDTEEVEMLVARAPGYLTKRAAEN